MNFSAKQVVSSSAVKLWWLRNYGDKQEPDTKYDDIRKKGSEYQEMIVETLFKDRCDTEMGGFVNVAETGDRIYFSNDIVLDNGNAIVECKCPMFDNVDDFLKQSIVQCAFYSFLSDQCTILTKAKFACAEGVEPSSIRLDDNFRYLLSFGSDMYEIKVKNHQMLWEWFKQKIINSIDYKVAKAYSESHPQKYQFEMLQDSFEYNKIG